MKTNPVSVHRKPVLRIGVIVPLLVIFSSIVTVFTSNGIIKELQQQKGDHQYDVQQDSAIMTMERSSPCQLHNEHDHNQLVEQVSGVSKGMAQMDDILNETNQVFITMPAKAAGSTMKSFTQKCMNMNLNLTDNFINRNENEVEKLISISYELPSIISSHLYSDKPFVRLVNSATRETLIIYIHREELPRVRSAIQHVLMSKICVPHPAGTKLMGKYHFAIERNENKCTIDEQSLIKLIKKRVQEVRDGASRILTCGYFDAIAQNTPSNLMFVHYKQADKLQKMLAKYHCPHLVKDLPIAENTADKKDVELFVQLKSNTSRNVTFTEWFDKKQNLIFWALDSKRQMDCQYKIMDMEDHLFSCPDEAMTLFRGEFKCVSLSNGTD